MHRERGLHLDEPDVTIDGQPVPAAILGTALTLFYAGRAQADRGQGIYFYLPKLESAAEARWYRDLFDASRERSALPARGDDPRHPARGVAACRVPDGGDALRARPLRGRAQRRALGSQGQHLRVRHDGSRSRSGPTASGWTSRPRRSSPNIFRRLVAICLKRGAVPIGGMATALPNPDPEVNRAAAEAIRTDKEWEARAGLHPRPGSPTSST